jgi:flagellar biogenesis protein FliO
VDWVATLLQLVKAVFLFVLVIGMAYVTTRFVGSRLGGVQARGRHLRVIEQVVIGRDRSLLLVEVAGKVYLVGAAADSIRLLTTIRDPETVESMLEEPDLSPAGFAGSPLVKLQGALKRVPAALRDLNASLRRIPAGLRSLPAALRSLPAPLRAIAARREENSFDRLLGGAAPPEVPPGAEAEANEVQGPLREQINRLKRLAKG